MVWLLALFPAVAADAPPEVPAVPKAPTAPETPALADTGGGTALVSPAVLVLGFRDIVADGDCDAWAARYGACVEQVEMVDPGPWRDPSTSLPAAQRRYAMDLSRLYRNSWQGIAWDWSDPESVVTTSFAGGGFNGPPNLAQTYGVVKLDARHPLVAPDGSMWLTRAEVGVAEEEGTAPMFPTVRWVGPDNATPVKDVVVLRGRFASRLGYDGRRHDYELMEGDPQSSAPFFEQIYPYARSMSGTDPASRPLSNFALSAGAGDATTWARAHSLLLGDGNGPAALARATTEFGFFSQLVLLQILRFSLDDVTENQMRVLSAIAAMQSPPGSQGPGAGLSRNIVAASRGQTDAPDAVSAAVDRNHGVVRLSRGIHYDVLPDAVVVAWVNRLPAIVDEDAAWRKAWDAALTRFFNDLIRPGAPMPSGADDRSLEQWVRTSLQPSVEPREALRQARWLALGAWVESRPADERARDEAWLLLDHAHHAVTGTFDASPGALTTPTDRVKGTATQWKAALNAHGYAPVPLAQGLGAVDPNAICTTRDGREALDEPSIGVVQLDELVVARDGLHDAADALWEDRHAQPFIGVDDPAVAAPKLERVVGLPSGRALYRVRWTLWSGWHLLWDTEPADGGGDRLVLRSAAICSDTVLSPRSLVPTLMRAALLAGRLLPTTTVGSADIKAHPEGPPREATVEAEEELAKRKPNRKKKKVEAPPTDAVAPFAGEVVTALTEDAGVHPILDEHLAWLQDLARTPLRTMAAQSKGVVVYVLDASAPAKLPALVEFAPQTPYRRRQSPLGKGLSLRTAAWATWLPAERGDEPVVAPAWRPTASSMSDSARQTWSRGSQTDFWLDLGVGLLPRREVDASCVFTAQDTLIVEPCDEASPTTYAAEGGSAELTALAAWWNGDASRWALEAGAFADLDAMHQGTSWFGGDDVVDVDRAWSFRPSFGLSLGARWMPPAGPLAAGGGGWPWGADREDGSSRWGRTQAGLRALVGFGSGFNGFEMSVAGEAWLGWSTLQGRNVVAAFQPYRPSLLLGPYARGEVSFLPNGDELDRAQALDLGWAVVVGLRTQIRLASAAPKPEAPTLPTAPEAPTLP